MVNIAFLPKELYFVLIKSGRLVSIGMRYASLVRVPRTTETPNQVTQDIDEQGKETDVNVKICLWMNVLLINNCLLIDDTLTGLLIYKNIV